MIPKIKFSIPVVVEGVLVYKMTFFMLYLMVLLLAYSFSLQS